MNLDQTVGARVARWWVEVITRTADRRAALDRREEVASDVYEQLTDAWVRGDLGAGSRAVISRLARGMPADVAWRVGLEARPCRLAWHLRNPSTAITFLFVVMFPINLVADSAGTRSSQLLDYRIPLWVLTDLVGFCMLIFAAVAMTARILNRGTTEAEVFVPQSRLERVRRCATAGLGLAWAGSAVFRFGPFSSVGTACWAGFGIVLVAYLLLRAITLAKLFLTLGRYLPKVWVWPIPPGM